MPKRLSCVFFKCSKKEFRLCRIIVDIENAQQNDVLAKVKYCLLGTFDSKSFEHRMFYSTSPTVRPLLIISKLSLVYLDHEFQCSSMNFEFD